MVVTQAYSVQAVEVFGDARHGGRHDGLVERGQEQAQQRADQDQALGGKVERFGVIDAVFGVEIGWSGLRHTFS